MRVDQFDFELPESAIALEPARPREDARLLHVPASGPFIDHRIRDLPDLLRAGDLLVFNDARVLPAALMGFRAARGEGADVRIEVNLHRRVDDRRWRAFARPGKRLRPGDLVTMGGLTAEIEAKTEDGDVLLAFDVAGEDLVAALEREGRVPLPPYILAKRDRTPADERDYQTVFASKPVAAAAPTAGLHFTEALLESIRGKGVESVCVTLHVGAGTFLPVKADDTADHVMHAEWRELSAEVAARVNAARADGRRVIAVGTTALRTLESCASDNGQVRPQIGDTSIFLTPGAPIRVADGLLTNFHLPRSTLFMLVSAFAGLDRMKAAYAHAIAQGYRFYSYGDASLLWRADRSGASVT